MLFATCCLRELWHKLAAKAHELGLPCVICELHFVKFTLCIYPFHVCKYNVISHVCMCVSWKIKFGLLILRKENYTNAIYSFFRLNVADMVNLILLNLMYFY